MQVGVGCWLGFEDRWAAVLRFLLRCNIFRVAVFAALHFFCTAVFVLHSSFCLRCCFFAMQLVCDSFFALQFVLRCIFLHCSCLEFILFALQSFAMQLFFVAVPFAVTEYLKQYSWDHQYHHYQYYQSSS